METLYKILETHPPHVKKTCEATLKSEKCGSLETRMASCYFVLKLYEDAIKILKDFPNMTHIEYDLLAESFYRQKFLNEAYQIDEKIILLLQDKTDKISSETLILGNSLYRHGSYILALESFKNLKFFPRHVINHIIPTFCKLNTMSELVDYLTSRINNWSINDLIQRELSLLLIVQNIDANIENIKQLLTLGASPCTMSKYNKCPLSVALSNHQDELILLYFKTLGYPIKFDEYTFENLSITLITDPIYYARKILKSRYLRNVNPGGEFFRVCNDICDEYLKPVDYHLDISDELCEFLIANKSQLNRSLKNYGYLLVKHDIDDD